jgi:hypothetical protein
VDWFPLGGSIFGASSKINIAYYEALTSMARMSTALDIKDYYTAQATALKCNIIKHLWNEDAQVMKMCDTSPPLGICQDINAYAVTTGIIPPTSILATPETTTLPLAFQNLPGWDKTPIISPHATGFAAEALFTSHETEAAIALLWMLK